jgi:hypothetical protein
MEHDTGQILDEIFRIPARRDSVKRDLETILDTQGLDIKGIVVQPDKILTRVGDTYLQVSIDEKGNPINREPIKEDEAIRLYAASILGSLDS